MRDTMETIRIFVSYDREHDGDLHDLLLEQSQRTALFEVSARSMPASPTDLWDQALRSAIQTADQVIVICGEHTSGSSRVGAELRITQEEQRPYFLLWGRRASMCTKPTTAKPADSMYSWTWPLLQNQILTTRRLADPSPRIAAADPPEVAPDSSLLVQS
jgi:hypothetical protein